MKPAGSRRSLSYVDPTSGEPAGPVHLASESDLTIGPAGAVEPTSHEDQMVCAPAGSYIYPSCEDRARREPAGALVSEIREVHRMREDILQAELKLGQKVWAICYRITGSKAGANRMKANLERGKPSADLAATAAGPLRVAQLTLAAERKGIEAELRKLGAQLPIVEWAENTRGLSVFGIAMIVGECGDPTSYRSEAALWKRMGVAVMPNGQRQRLVAGDAEAAVENGYNPRRRSVLFRVGSALVKCANGPYREFYLREKMRLADLHPDRTKKHLHLAAQRHMEKRLLRDLRRAWVSAIIEPSREDLAPRAEAQAA